MKRVKIRRVSAWNMVIAVLVGVLFAVISAMVNRQFQQVQTATEQYIVCESAAEELLEGSNYLTEQVRLYTMTGQQQYLDSYFEEADVTCRRENALESLRAYFDGTEAFTALQSAMDNSKTLMNTEYYAMRLVLEAKGGDVAAVPQSLQNVVLSADDLALSASGKLARAQQLVSGVDYENAQKAISDEVSQCMDALIQQTHTQQSRAATIFTDMYHKLEIGIVILVVLLLGIGIMVRRLVVVPLVKCSESIQQGKTFPVEGADELQLLAENYNKMFLENQEAQLLIRHKAEHDAMTDLLNRGSFEKLLHIHEAGDAPFALIMVDVDSFKSVNDTCGHAAGDAALKKVASLLTTAFRSIDYVCRIGGDEFAVIMVEMTSDLSYTIQEKVDAINAALAADTEDGLPHVSLSVGVAFSDRPNPGGSIFQDADKALYARKANGKAGCMFYQ